MTCDIIRYKISREPFEPRKAAVKCMTHGWTAYDGQMGGVIDDECPIGRAERLEGVTDAQRLAAVTAFVEAQPDRQIEAMAQAVLDLRLELAALAARLDEIAVMLIKLGGKL
jgi:hypothetical protein